MTCKINFWDIENFAELNNRYKFLFTLFQIVRPDGTANITKAGLGEYLGITRQTLGSYLNELERADILKYKTNGALMINPKTYYTGDEVNYALVCENYKNF